MTTTPFAPLHRATLAIHGGLLFLLGLVVGLAFTFVAIGRIEIWPLPALHIQLPGAESAWRQAHLGLMFNAVTVLAFAGVAGFLALSPREQRLYAWSVLITAWFNSAGFLAGTLSGSRGLAVDGSGGHAGNNLAYGCFLLAALTAFVQGWLLVAGGWRARRPAAPG